ncbi:hypothetical protein BASA60_001880 [Batrachochytrium salamandrivorans]|nr:hypothetical protein BASA60_001880 [Batrachochytrium salamandrivorans]
MAFVSTIAWLPDQWSHSSGKGQANRNSNWSDVGEFSASEAGSKSGSKGTIVHHTKLVESQGNVDLAGAEQWKSSLTTMFTGYNLRNVFNMDETGNFSFSVDHRKVKKSRSFRGVDMSKFKTKYVKSAKAWMTNPRFNIYLKDLMSSGRNHVMGKYCDLVTDETIQKCFAKCGFAVPAIQQEDITEVLEQEEELASLAERIGVDESKLVIEEHLPQFDVQEKQNSLHS